jgi:nucleoside-diphosphate-sugar epimerase
VQPEARRANLDSTREVLQFAFAAQRARPGLRLHYASTAYVAGDRRGRLLESELLVGQEFCNSYEQSKAEAERLVADAGRELAVTIYRPSHVVGESATGRIARFFGFYDFIRAAARGKLPLLLAEPEAPIDMVPVDYVCDAILGLSGTSASVGRTYHVAAGLARSLGIQQLVSLVHAVQRQVQPALRVREPRIIRPRLFTRQASPEEQRSRATRSGLLLRTYLPYFTYGRDFDVEGTHRLLGGLGVHLPPTAEVLQASTRYAIQRGFVGFEEAAALSPGSEAGAGERGTRA